MGLWSVATSGFIDIAANADHMSASFARTFNLNFNDLNVTSTGALNDLQPRPGGPGEMGFQLHRCRYHRLGSINVDLNLAHCSRLPRTLPRVTFRIFDDSVLPRGSSVDIVLSWASARRCPA